MPEGDTVHRVAARLRTVLEGRLVLHADLARARGPGRIARGDRVRTVRAVGKHLEIEFERGSVLRTHLGMGGSWRVYRAGMPWGRPAHRAAVALTVPGWTVVCFDTRRVELGRVTDRHLAQLGPDLCADDDATLVTAAVQRLARFADASTTIGEALLDQRIAAGIGNIHRSEILFRAGLDPATPVADLDAETRRAVYEVARRSLTQAVAGGRTRPAVYGRAGRPCRRCGTTIRVRRLGEGARAVWWCPTCQPPVGARSAPST
ncbi:MAG: Fpg/Nei family DNA glycosylase [Actinomyces sp.]|nr:MAG: Fpg/Nei family DNA glycosylase [Actinomyces sp.]